MQMIGWNQTLGSIVEASFVPVAVNFTNQGQLVILRCVL